MWKHTKIKISHLLNKIENKQLVKKILVTENCPRQTSFLFKGKKWPPVLLPKGHSFLTTCLILSSVVTLDFFQ